MHKGREVKLFMFNYEAIGPEVPSRGNLCWEAQVLGFFAHECWEKIFSFGQARQALSTAATTMQVSIKNLLSTEI